MSTKRYKPEQIVNLLRQIEVEIANGKTTPQACRDAEITTQTYYRWRKEFGGLKLDQAKWLNFPWRSRFCAMWRRETAKPRAAALCGGACTPRVRIERTACLPAAGAV